MNKILVLGGSGLVGKAIISEINKCKEFKTYATYFKNPMPLNQNRSFKLNIEDMDNINNILNTLKPQNIISCLRGDYDKQLILHTKIAEYLKKDIFVDLLNKFYEDKSKIDISLNILGTFISTGTLFLAPALSSELLDFHRNHHTYFKAFNENENSFYLPGKWGPHCTIASRLSDDNMILAFKYCKNNLTKTSGKLNEIALLEVEFNDEGISIEDRIVFSKILK